MIDFVTVCYKNYDLLLLQIENFRSRMNKDEYRLIVVDNTPHQFKDEQYLSKIEKSGTVDKVLQISNSSIHDFDGVSHGRAIDLGVSVTTSDIVCVMDSDFFIMMPNIITYVYDKFEKGYYSVGCQFHDGTTVTTNLIDRFPELFQRCATVFCGFYNASIIKQNTFIIEQNEINWQTSYIEVGYRIRKYMNDNKLPGFLWNQREISRPTIFMNEFNDIAGVHLCRGTFTKINESLLTTIGLK